MNNIEIRGNLGRDAEHRATASGKGLVRLSVADSPKDGVTIWWNVTVWEDAPGYGAAQSLAKGEYIEVRGWVKAREWTDNAGVKRTALDVTAKEIEKIVGNATKTVTDGPKPLGGPRNDDIPF